jgi:hypothetical protein
MFTPTRDQARAFLIQAWAKRRAALPETPLEAWAADVVQHHPEYHALLEDKAAADRDFSPEEGQINPFLHLSLHLAITEQLSIDQPPGLRRHFQTLCVKTGDEHQALHVILEALAETLYAAQRTGQPPDAKTYLDRIEKQIGQ